MTPAERFTALVAEARRRQLPVARDRHGVADIGRAKVNADLGRFIHTLPDDVINDIAARIQRMK